MWSFATEKSLRNWTAPHVSQLNKCQLLSVASASVLNCWLLTTRVKSHWQLGHTSSLTLFFLCCVNRLSNLPTSPAASYGDGDDDGDGDGGSDAGGGEDGGGDEVYLH